MPQMAPLSWTCLFIYFCILMMITAPLNYFLFIRQGSSQIKTPQTTPINWKW